MLQRFHRDPVRQPRGRYSLFGELAFEIRPTAYVYRTSGWSTYESRRSGARSRRRKVSRRLIYRPISPPYRVRFSGASHLTDDIPTKTGARVKTPGRWERQGRNCAFFVEITIKQSLMNDKKKSIATIKLKKCRAIIIYMKKKKK